MGYYTSTNGLILCGARWYDPEIGRWLTRDPIGYGGGSNLYEYAASNPLSYLDPDGTDLKSIRDWYMGGMGGASAWTDRWLMGGSTSRYGEVAGRYDAGQASSGELAWAFGDFGANLASSGFLGGGLARGAFRALAGRTAANATVACATKPASTAFATGLFVKTARGANIPKVFAALKMGRDAHADYFVKMAAKGLTVDKAVFAGSKLRPDAVDFVNKIIYELKPAASVGSRKTLDQVLKYLNLANKQFGPGWTYKIHGY